ncbi:Apolipophorin [Caenorhabditis elegans]|uniref:Apolipophorin n=1 Tax=Caenorhabditis elegans TaxID=6239 RepID=Q95XM3_CAEEL|nr:Apolipophorin [Caenorhabditis elegans]CCD67996.2 Apolipophorin [Caenorhabditis elegans]|eukprot:NP_490897.3 Uncharacterized protein CELE_Y71G12B.5 [Caenorhabditis elegans]
MWLTNYFLLVFLLFRTIHGLADGSETTVKEFLSKVSDEIATRDASRIATLFSDGFSFQGCKGKYDKETATKILSKLPAGTPFSFTLKSAKPLSDDRISYIVSINGFGAASIDALFILCAKTLTLASGSIVSCPPRHFSDHANPEEIVKTFLGTVTKALESKDASRIATLFSDDFSFKGCKGTYDKQSVIKMLSNIPAGTPFSFTIKSAKFIATGRIEHVVSINGFSATPLEAQFILCPQRSVLVGGSIPSCPQRHFLAGDNSNLVANKFLDRLPHSIASRDSDIILGLFRPDFTFKGCAGTYNKAEAVKTIMSLPADKNATFTLKTSQNKGKDQITIICTVTGISKSPSDIELTLSLLDQQLAAGTILSCPKRSFTFDQASDVIISAFLDKMTYTLATKSSAKIGDLFAESFVFKGCRATYDKQANVELLSSLPRGTPFSFTLKSSHFISEYKIEYLVALSGFGVPTHDAKFVFCSKRRVLISGEIPACQPKRFFASSKDNSVVTVKKFMGKLTDAIKSKDLGSIGGLFADAFVFKGCKSDYTKEQIMKTISQLPAGADGRFHSGLKSAEDHGSTIKYVVGATGTGNKEVLVEFYLNKQKLQLESGLVPSCQKNNRLFVHHDFPVASWAKRKFFELIAHNDGSLPIVQEALEKLKKAVLSGRKEKIANFFNQEFNFHGCKSSYNKYDTVEMLSRYAGSAFEMRVTSSRFVDYNAEIEYTVIVQGFGVNKIMADFHLTRNIGSFWRLSSGVMTNCEAPRTFLSGDSSRIAGEYMIKLQRAIDLRSTSLVNDLFADDYVFEACGGKIFYKHNVTELLTNYSLRSSVTHTLKSARYINNREIDFTAEFVGLYPKPILIQFVLDFQKGVVLHGKAPNCEAPKSFLDFPEESDRVANNILNKLQYAIDHRSASAVMSLIADDYTFQACGEKCFLNKKSLNSSPPTILESQHPTT